MVNIFEKLICDIYINMIHYSFVREAFREISKLLPDKLYLSLLYYVRFRKWINWKNPKTFNEKIQWLKIYDRKYIYTEFADKVAVKDHIEVILGKDILVPTLGVFEKIDDIDFSLLPDKFVMKCNHDGGGTSVILCKDKNTFDIDAARRQIEACLKRNAYWYGREYCYKHIKPCILIEKYLEDSKSLKDYKFMVFNGRVKCSFVCSNREVGSKVNVTFFDLDWNKLPFCRSHPTDQHRICMPINYKRMIEYSEKIAMKLDTSFVRVDFYEVHGVVYFGEVTFYPGSGFEAFQPIEWDRKMGSWLHLF